MSLLQETGKKCIVIVVGYKASRCGLDDDLKAITETFTNLFDAEVICCVDYTRNQIIAKYREFKTEEWLLKFNVVDFVTVFCLAHGNTDGRVICGNTAYDDIADVRRLLLAPLFKIKELDGKLKWLVVQSCRGALNDYEPRRQMDGKKSVFPDYHFISYCTGEGTISYQIGVGGKIYIQSLCRELQENASKQSLSRMLINVGTAVEAYGAENSFSPFAKPEFIKNCDDYTFF